MNNTTLTLKNINKTFRQGNEILEVLKDVNLDIRPKEVVALIGPSGSGKSTLLQIAGLLENPTDGEVYIDGENCTGNSDNVRTMLRRDYLGFVYQYHNLLKETGLSALIATHNIDLAHKMDRVVSLKDGRLIDSHSNRFLKTVENFY